MRDVILVTLAATLCALALEEAQPGPPPPPQRLAQHHTGPTPAAMIVVHPDALPPAPIDEPVYFPEPFDEPPPPPFG